MRTASATGMRLPSPRTSIDPFAAPSARRSLVHEEEQVQEARPHRHLLVVPGGQELLADLAGEPRRGRGLGAPRAHITGSDQRA